MLEIGAKLDLETLTKIWHNGHSRIPVYEIERNNIVGMLFTKDLILVRAEDEMPVRTVFSFYGQPLFRVFPEIKLDRILYGMCKNEPFCLCCDQNSKAEVGIWPLCSASTGMHIW